MRHWKITESHTQPDLKIVSSQKIIWKISIGYAFLVTREIDVGIKHKRISKKGKIFTEIGLKRRTVAKKTYD